MLDRSNIKERRHGITGEERSEEMELDICVTLGSQSYRGRRSGT